YRPDTRITANTAPISTLPLLANRVTFMLASGSAVFPSFAGLSGSFKSISAPLISTPSRRVRHGSGLDPRRRGHHVTHLLIHGIFAPSALRVLDTRRLLPRRFMAEDQSHPHRRHEGQ